MPLFLCLSVVSVFGHLKFTRGKVHVEVVGYITNKYLGCGFFLTETSTEQV